MGFKGSSALITLKEIVFNKSSRGSQALYTQNPNILNKLERNSVLTIRPISVIRIQVVGCSSIIDIRYSTLQDIGMLPNTAHNLKFPFSLFHSRKGNSCYYHLFLNFLIASIPIFTTNHS